MAGTGKPVGSTDFQDAEVNLENFDKILNSEQDTVFLRETPTNPNGKEQPTVQGLVGALSNDVQQAINSSGWFVVGEFSSGFTYTAANQVGRDADGNMWSYNDSLPFTVSAGTTPSSPDYTNRGDATVRSDINKGKFTINGYINVKGFGAVGDGFSDDTAAIQSALDFCESQGGGIVYLPAGTYCLSIAESINLHSCLIIPANITLSGDGKNLTTIKRLPSERGVDGILLVNKGFDTVTTPYGASGNLVFRDFTITDGAIGPSRTGGDLIGVGNCENVIVHDIHFGVHDQHGVDLAGVRNCHIYNCTGLHENDGGYIRSATVQVDGAPGMIGQANVDVNSENILVENNHFINLTSREVLHVGHKPQAKGIYKNIRFINNIIDGAYSAFHYAVYNDPNTAFDGLEFTGNTFKTNHAEAYSLNLSFNGPSTQILKNVTISNNKVLGLARVGIFVGNTGGLTTYPLFENIKIFDNLVDIRGESSDFIYGISVGDVLSAQIHHNTVNVATQSAVSDGIHGIWVQRKAKVCVIESNVVEVSADTIDPLTDNSYGIRASYSGAITESSETIIRGNTVNQKDVRYGIVLSTLSSAFNLSVDSALISSNKFIGDLVGQASLFDEQEFSDLTNGGVKVEMPNGTYVQTMGASEIHTISNYGNIKSYQGKVKLIPSLKTAQGFHQVNNLEFGGAAHGIYFSNITKDSFSLRTGSGGVTALLSSTTLNNEAIASGDVSVKAWI